MMPKPKGQPKWRNEPVVNKKVKYASNPESTDKQTIAWQFHRRDHEHREWGWDRLTDAALRDLIRVHLSHLETMTWAELAQAAGGRRHGNNHHAIPVEDCAPEAQRRLQELQLDDVDELFSIRITARWRLFGVREGRVLRFVWCDQEHTVCPVRH